MNISVFGLGYVGCVSVGCLAKNGHNVIGVDVSEIKVKQINSGLATIIEKDIDIIIQEEHSRKKIVATTDYASAILKTDVSIVAVGTPTGLNGHLNLSYIFDVADHFGKVIKKKKTFHVIAIRSTVLPGTAEKFARIIEHSSGKKNNTDFAVVSNPEFLREGTAVYDYYHPPITLIGASNSKAADIIVSLYSQLPGEVIVTDIQVAEIMKYVNNSFHALKIAFANEVGNICSAMKIDSHKVMEIFCTDHELNISSCYLKPGFAYGGSCLPKDLKGLQTLAHDLYVRVPVIESIDKTNELQIARAIELIQNTGKRRIAFLGISFKPGTDDLRSSPAVTIAEALIGKGYDVKIYDKNVNLSKLNGANREYIDIHIPHLSKLMVNQLGELIDDVDVIIVSNREAEYVDVLLETESSAIIIDMVRLPDPIRLRRNYVGINW
ncbi:nucleotide sugar dehydrogenase [Paraflavitalea sp. CAU 1676]|uniref:nucleotide sugar dehydrogenase n=1 Tax=Paraflavitalea sp. CAU 1676 TaxID=3032598 RepID=UPI0023D9D5C5|nr:nucleotide sugar dehydrogenase [Paraflavitalea sp. CAU 1676]MDF2188460.1 nucleotide sugar dehydrogenase [Paraflavitalea sp. CAU 1676]